MVYNHHFLLEEGSLSLFFEDFASQLFHSYIAGIKKLNIFLWSLVVFRQEKKNSDYVIKRP